MAELALAAVSLVKRIRKVYEELEEQDNRADALYERVSSLEPALQVFRKDMEDKNKHTKPYERVLKRLNETLEDVEELLAQNNSSGLGFIRRLFGGAGTKDEKEYKRLMTELSTAIADMNFAIQATKAANHDSTMNTQADKVVNKLSKAQEQNEKEGVAICVQCGESYKERTNGPGHCRFHTARATNSGYWSCCQRQGNNAKGCTSNTHRKTFHHEYPYSTYYAYIDRELGKNATTWLEMAMDEHEKGYPDRTIRIGNRTDKAIFIFIKNDGWSRFYLSFTDAQLKKIPAKRKNGSPIIVYEGTHDTDDTKTWSVTATWNISGGKVTGITAAVKTISADVPLVKSVSFSDSRNLGKIVTVSGEKARGLGATHKKGHYGLKAMKTGTRLPEELFEEPMDRQPQFETQVPDGWKFRIRPNADPVLKVNVRQGVETFSHDLMLVNTGTQVVGILAAECELYVDGRWKPGKAKLTEPAQFSIDIEPRKTFNMKIDLSFDRPSGKTGIFYYSSWHAAFGPIRYRLILEDLDGERCIHYFQYQNPSAIRQATRNDGKGDPNYITGGYLDDVDSWCRLHWNAAFRPKDNYREPQLRIEANSIGETYSEENLEEVAYECRTQGVSELEQQKRETSDGCRSVITALYDREINQVYAFRIELVHSNCSLVDYFLYPLDYVVDLPRAKLNPQPEIPREDKTVKHPRARRPELPNVDGRRDSDPTRAISRSSTGRKGRATSQTRSTGRSSNGRKARNRSRGRSAAGASAVKGPRRSRARSKSASRKGKAEVNDFMSLSSPSQSTTGGGQSPTAKKVDMLNSAPEGTKNVRASMANIVPGSAKGMRQRFESMNR